MRILSGPELGVFKEVVNGSASTKAVLLDQLKQRYDCHEFVITEMHD